MYTSGNTYSGSWERDAKSGKGTMTWLTTGTSSLHSVSLFHGLHFINNTRVGLTTCVFWTVLWLNAGAGERYTGQWLSDKPHGSGIMVWLDPPKPVSAARGVVPSLLPSLLLSTLTLLPVHSSTTPLLN